ncbi:hypothetical protein SO802_025993 [Lithocarpus litseifolius]|uniref:RNase H type-1 domain-containing protein n=1 Tax=Lithocarpus litseifolius TaxID=425828 RepID=A0AAW2C0E8_9ROSI
MQATEFFLCINRPRNNRRMITKHIRWEKPASGWMKLNTDGSFDDLLEVAGEGGLIRDEQGNWVAGYTRRVGRANSFIAEGWALKDGLVLCSQLNLSSIIVESDAKALINAFNNLVHDNSVVFPLLDDCKELAAQFSRIVSRHVYREANSCADRLANMGRLQNSEFVGYSSSPVELLTLIMAGCQGLYSKRLCLDTLFSC